MAGTQEPGTWRLAALCAQTDPEAFFPEKGGSAAAALATCRRCPVTAECLAFALDNDERFGVWGGTTEPERRQLRRDRQEAADGLGRVAGLCARGDGRWALTVKYRRPDGTWGQVGTTVLGDRDAALQRLSDLRARAAQLAAGDATAERAA